MKPKAKAPKQRLIDLLAPPRGLPVSNEINALAKGLGKSDPTELQGVLKSAPKPIVFAKIGNNSREAVRVALEEYKGARLIDIRTVCQWGEAEGFRPTRKGVSLKIEHLPELLDALNGAHAEAQRMGILPKVEA